MSETNFSGPIDSVGGFKVNGTTVIDSNGKLIESASIEIANGDSFLDTNGNEVLKFNINASAVNELTITNAITTAAPVISATGGDANINVKLLPKGTGAIDLAGAIIGSEITATSGAGAVALTGSLHQVSTTAASNALTLANGTAGQKLTVIYVAETAGADTAILTPTTLAGGTTVTFNALGDSADLTYSATGGWYKTGGTAAIA